MTAIEALLVSLYGFRPNADLPADKHLSSEPFPSPSSPLQADSERNAENSHSNDSVPRDGPKQSSADTSLDRQASNCSSSSSIADDWIVNQIPADLESNFSLYDDEMSQTVTKPASKSPERLVDNKMTAATISKVQISAEDWSRGTALTDPVSGEPLQPVIIHRPTKQNHSVPDEAMSESSSRKKTLNAITEKRAALTAYDMISNRTMRAPLSPVTIFEKEARAEVLREKPTASLQDISVAIHERWKNLREEDRKK